MPASSNPGDSFVQYRNRLRYPFRFHVQRHVHFYQDAQRYHGKRGNRVLSQCHRFYLYPVHHAKAGLSLCQKRQNRFDHAGDFRGARHELPVLRDFFRDAVGGCFHFGKTVFFFCFADFHWGRLFFDEPILASSLCGGALIILSSLYLSVTHKNKAG